jgi:uncharacterized protein involved in exopolysaccharide biosynthesis
MMEDEINLFEYWLILKKHWKLLVVFVLIFGFLGWVQAIRQPKVYRATATIMFVANDLGGLGGGGASAVLWGNRAGFNGSLNQISAILTSNCLAREILADIDPHKFFPNSRFGQKVSADVRNKIFARILSGSVSIKDVDGMMAVSVVWREPQQAADLTNLYIDHLGEFFNRRGLNINFQVLDPAERPVSAYSQQKKRMILTSAILGLVLAFVLIIFLEFIDKQRGQHRA